MGILGAIKAFFGALGQLFGFLDRKQLLDAGAAKASNEIAQKTIETTERVNRPITDDDRQRMRDKYRAP